MRGILKKLIHPPCGGPILGSFRLVKRDVVDRLQRGVGSVFASFGSNEPEKQRRAGTDLPARVWREGGKALTLHEPLRAVGAGEALADVPGD